jgi:hypothetical protein
MVEILGHHHGKPGGNRENKHRPKVERELLYSRGVGGRGGYKWSVIAADPVTLVVRRDARRCK